MIDNLTVFAYYWFTETVSIRSMQLPETVVEVVNIGEMILVLINIPPYTPWSSRRTQPLHQPYTRFSLWDTTVGINHLTG